MTVPTDDGARRARFIEKAEALRLEMEDLAGQVRDSVLAQPPIKLLGYVLSLFQMANMRTVDDAEGPDKEVLKTFQFALEYLHAVWCSHSPLVDESTDLDEAGVNALMELLERLAAITMMYCMASSAGAENARSAQVEFHAKSSWALIRGHRYQVLEDEFFAYVLAPHAKALREAYDMEPEAIAKGLQNISDAFRSGFSDAAETLFAGFDKAMAEVEATGADLASVVAALAKADPDFMGGMSSSAKDMFMGGVCNLSRHSSLSVPLLEDLSLEPGQDARFYAAGEFAGTPMRALPGRSRPGIKLDGEYYATDGQFIRDSAYRAIQWGLWKRLKYRDEWQKRQAHVVEQAFPGIFTRQLEGAQIHEGVYYRDPQTGDWAETDLVIALDDVLIVVEAKAGVMPMQSPATNFASHERVIQDLIVKAYQQCRRFLEYLESQPEAPLFHFVDGKYVEIGRLRKKAFRLLLPVGLTVEAFTPFSALAKELPEVTPILGAHPFMSMSVDDLFVLTRFLPTTGELIHYLEVRQAVAGLPGAMLFDEIDHLGAYVSNNRFDYTIKEQLKTADLVTWSQFSDIVDRHFEGPDWAARPVPAQDFPDLVRALLAGLDRIRPSGWLEMDGHLRDMGGDLREGLAQSIRDLFPTLTEHPRRRIQLGDAEPLQVWVCRLGAFPSEAELRRHAEAGCLVGGARRMSVLTVTFDAAGVVQALACSSISAPSMLRNDYAVLQAEAERLRARSVSLTTQKGRTARTLSKRPRKT